MDSRTKASSGATPRLLDILIVEDDADTREALREVFESNRCLVRSACDAREAELALRDRVPDVVLSDLHLGGDESGWTFAERMRDDPRTRHVARIAMTGQVDPRLEVVRAFDAYLRKPLDVPLLLDLVRQLAMISRGARRVAV